MQSFKLKSILFSLALAAVFSSCRKDKTIGPDNQSIAAVRKGLYILNQGSFNSNNSTLSYYDYDTKALVPDQFFTANNRGLGDTGNDAEVYGSKLYIVVDVSNTLEVVDAKTAKSIKQISFVNGTTGRQPRNIVFNQNKAYVSSYDGTVAVIDTASLTVEQYITVGRNPEKMAITNGKLYVANSGGLSYPNYDKTVSVIDLTTKTVTKTITVTENPNGVAADKYGNVYILSFGNYADVSPAMTIIDSKTDVVTKTFADFNGNVMSINGDYLYIAGNAYDATGNASSYVKLFNVKTVSVEKANFITDGTVITTAYGINADPFTGEVFVTDAKNYSTNGEVFCFSSAGVKKYSLTTGINPGNVTFINK
ncbi:YncE family protein [Pedobacter sp. L105]|uniref:YncE family protein n=1 Tax=Pedobacter sp. L105 TaxID=1641871 RepID=UPI00131E88AE|nr:DUF5074 domain-containing protein [Pedobacter sp. L105]